VSSVLVVGSLNEDVRVAVDRRPEGGETVLGGDIHRDYGGKGGNQAVAAALAGARTAMVAAVGDDVTGQAYRRRLAAFGVDVSGVVVRDAVPTGTAIIIVDADGENSIVVAPGANSRLAVTDLSPVDALTAGDVLLMQLEVDLDVVADAARRAARVGARIVLNMAPYATLPADVLALADPVVVNQHEDELMRSSGRVPGSVLVTLGDRGSRWGDLQVPAEPARVVDTTGAGDAYCGALAAALAAGLDRTAAMRTATKAAAQAVTHVGAQPEPPG
jgi:ribokinase